MTMQIPGGIHPKLVLVYRNSIYLVRRTDGKDIPLRVSTVNRELAALMVQHGKRTGAFLTAFNPYSHPTDDLENQSAQSRMENLLISRGIELLHGEGRDPTGAWPAEPSVLALGITLSAAEEMAREFGQNGFVWVASAEGLVALKLLRPLLIPAASELAAWRETLSPLEAAVAEGLTPREQATLISVSPEELSHWLFPQVRDLTVPWPMTLPDGSAIGAGTELDRMFCWLAAGLTASFTEYVESVT